MAPRPSPEAHILDLHGGDPFGHVIEAAERHRAAHGPACGLYPAGPHVMRLAATIARAAGARRILDVGTGLGYSALWLADAAGLGAVVDAIDRFEEHVVAARAIALAAGLAERIRFVAGEAVEVLARLEGPYDVVHDDGWFAAEPPYVDRVIELLRPGGVWTMPNWFLLRDAAAGKNHRRWAAFAGERWEEVTLAYAARLAADRRIDVTWSLSPPLGIAVKRVDPARGP